MVRIRRILCPVDFSPASNHAVQYAAELARSYDASLKLLHVASPIIPASYEYPIDTTALLQTMQKASERQMQRLLAKTERSRVNVDGAVVTGDIIGQIKDEIESTKPDLVVMGAHGKGLLDRIFLGSTAERVVRAALCPVMVIPPEKKRAAKATPRKRAT